MDDSDLEAAIDAAGRERVFLMVECSGWPRSSQPPKWVWWEAVRLVNEMPATPVPSFPRAMA